MLIIVKEVTGRVFQLRLKLKSTVSDLKHELMDKHGFAREQQRLMFAGKWLQENSKRLRDYDQLGNGSVIHFSMQSQEIARSKTSKIFVKDVVAGNCIELAVAGADTVQIVKEKIQDSELGIPSQRQRLLLGGVLMEDERTLKEYNVPPFSTLFLSISRPRYISSKSSSASKFLPAQGLNAPDASVMSITTHG